MEISRLAWIEKLQELGAAIKHKGEEPNPNILLQFLAENHARPRAQKGTNERFLEILDRNLHSPHPGEHWKFLIEDNRPVQEACYRKYIWTMATTSVRLSKGMFDSWVTNPSEIHGIAAHPSFRVRAKLNLSIGGVGRLTDLSPIGTDSNHDRNPHVE